MEFVVRSNKKEVRGLTENIIFLYLSLNYGDIYMDIDKVIQTLSEALDDKDWDIIKELLEELIYEDENPIKEYEKDKDLDENLWG